MLLYNSLKLHKSILLICLKYNFQMLGAQICPITRVNLRGYIIIPLMKLKTIVGLTRGK